MENLPVKMDESAKRVWRELESAVAGALNTDSTTIQHRAKFKWRAEEGAKRGSVKRLGDELHRLFAMDWNSDEPVLAITRVRSRLQALITVYDEKEGNGSYPDLDLNKLKCAHALEIALKAVQKVENQYLGEDAMEKILKLADDFEAKKVTDNG